MGNATRLRPMTFRMDVALLDDLKAVANMTGRTMTEVVTNALDFELSHYRNEDSCVKPVKAYRLTGVTDYDKKVAKNEGKQAKITRHDCYVLGEVTMMGQPYYHIYDVENETLMKVPKDNVMFVED